jgi:prepilin peptidase CpaA
MFEHFAIDYTNITGVAAACLFCLFLIIAAVGDVKSFTITNSFNMLFFSSFFILAPILGLGLDDIFYHLMVAIAAFLICFALFALGLFGGGDVKLVGATAIWLGAGPMMFYAFYTALFGGVLALLLLVARYITSKAGLPKNPRWLRQLLRKHSAIPYGVALCIGGICALPQVSWL